VSWMLLDPVTPLDRSPGATSVPGA